MQLVPSQDDVVELLRNTGGLRSGHFELPNGLHGANYLQVALTMRYYRHAKELSVGLSRLLRANPEIHALIPQLSVVAPAPAGLPVAYGVSEALQAHQVYWAEKNGEHSPMRFRQFLAQSPGEKVLLVDDIRRSGTKLAELKTLVESRGAEVVGLAVIVYQPMPTTINLNSLPFYYLARLDEHDYQDAASCELCKRGVPVERVWI